MKSHCLICDQTLHERLTWMGLCFPRHKSLLCDRCAEKFQEIEGDICEVCGRPLAMLEEKFVEGSRCLDCVKWEQHEEWRGLLSHNRSLYVYNDWMKEVLALYKFRGDYELANIFRVKWEQAYERHYRHYEVIVPIPLSDKRLYERGFNQSEVLARFLRRSIQDVLGRSHHEKQSKKTRKERLETEQLFIVKHKEAVYKQDVLLIDDIYTTGATIRHAAKVLKLAGACSVSSLTLARG